MTLSAFLARHRYPWSATAAIVCCLALSLLTASAAGAAALPDIDERPETERISQADVEKVTPTATGGDRILLEADAPQPEEGDPVVVPISAVAPEGVLGIATDVESIGGDRSVVETRPATLASAYSEIDLEGQTLGELTRGTAAMTLLAQRFKCTGAGKVDGPKITPGLEDLKLDLHMNLPRRELRFVLAGKPTIGVTVAADGEARCRYVGNAGIPIPIAGTPILLTISPAARAKTTGSFESSFSWGPEVEIGVDKPRGEPARGVHEINASSPKPPSFKGQADVTLFLGFGLSLSVAGRAGIEGTAGPRIKASIEADNAAPCVTATAEIAYDLTAFAKVFVKRLNLSLTEGAFAVTPLWERGACPPEGAVLARA